jgi:ArsR family transcriptional regulator, arsenate/arsenite/antimonite-responsive transcriptional repressor
MHVTSGAHCRSILTSVDASVYFYLAMTESDNAFNRTLHAISDPTRRRILQALKKSPAGNHAGLCASDIEIKIRLSQPTISHHMAVLQKAGLVDAKKEGLWRWYRRNETALSAFTRKLRRSL